MKAASGQGQAFVKADDLLEHSPDTLRRQLLSDNLLSFINQATAPISVTELYTHFSPASPFQIQARLRELFDAGPKSLDIYTIRDMATLISAPLFRKELKKFL